MMSYHTMLDASKSQRKQKLSRHIHINDIMEKWDQTFLVYR